MEPKACGSPEGPPLMKKKSAKIYTCPKKQINKHMQVKNANEGKLGYVVNLKTERKQPSQILGFV